ncbi:GGDEF domain-containing protein, partial [Rhizobium johnstonii]|uniref:GGDEF domain-containing protein n=1 Tax=Rhizobium johnstonii TaxID=3019933 RepID=UPI003F951D4E
RFGGDEFLVICEDADIESATAIADRLRAAIADPIHGIPAEFGVSASIGVATYRFDGRRSVAADEFFASADAAMYRSKRAGKD